MDNNMPGHEVHDAGVRPIVLAGAALAVGVAIVFVIVFGGFHYFATHPTAEPLPNPMATKGQAPPAPRIEEHPTIEYRDLRAHENQVLGNYGWADKKAGVVRLPIDRAMELVLERGLPTRKEAANK